MAIVVEVSKSATNVVAGVISVNEKNPKLGSIMFRSAQENGFVLGKSFSGSAKAPVGFHTDDIEVLKKFVQEQGIVPGKVLDGFDVVVKEQTTPFWEGQSPKINPETGEIKKSNGMPIYRNTFIVGAGTDISEFLPMDSAEATTNSEVNSILTEAGKVQ
jgi:hypothetical protein